MNTNQELRFDHNNEYIRAALVLQSHRSSGPGEFQRAASVMLFLTPPQRDGVFFWILIGKLSVYGVSRDLCVCTFSDFLV